MKPGLKISFSRYSDSKLETIAEFILQSMTGNANFVSPIPTLADLEIALNNYRAALVNSVDNSRLAVSEKRQSRQTLELLLGQLSMYVMYIANGNDVILTSSGFPLVKEREARIIANPGPVKLSIGVSEGQLKAWVDGVSGAISYIHQITPAPLTEASVWESVTSSRSKMMYSNLMPGIKYHVRIAAVGPQNQTTLSPESSMYVS